MAPICTKNLTGLRSNFQDRIITTRTLLSDSRRGKTTVLPSSDLVSSADLVQPALRAVRHQYRGIPRHALDNQHPAAGGQAGVRRGLVPVPELVADEDRVGLLLILDRVVDDQNVAVMGEDPFNEEVPRRGLEINCYFTFSSNQLRNAACGPARSE